MNPYSLFNVEVFYSVGPGVVAYHENLEQATLIVDRYSASGLKAILVPVR